MRVLCAPDSFKGSLTAAQAARAMQRGVAAVDPDIEVDLCPIADGGEGTVDTLLAAVDGERRVSTVTGPRGKPVEAAWGVINDPITSVTAIIELASAAGLTLLDPAERDPTKTTTYGVGELIRIALDAGVDSVLVGIGGSATHDGAAGAAQALGVRFFDREGELITTPMTGGMLERVGRVDLSQRDARLKRTTLNLACDVTNPLIGPDGAAFVYSPQKGATPEQVRVLDEGMRHFIGALTTENHGATAVLDLPGAGAAGGFGGGAVAMLRGQLQRGIERILDVVRFSDRVRQADLVLTGEGRIDGQSASGKAVAGVVGRCKAAGVPVWALAGCEGDDATKLLDAGLAGYRTIAQGLDVNEAMRRAAELLERAAAELMRERMTELRT